MRSVAARTQCTEQSAFREIAMRWANPYKACSQHGYECTSAIRRNIGAADVDGSVSSNWLGANGAFTDSKLSI